MESLLFLVSRYPKGNNNILEKDIIRKISEKGNKVKVVCPIENGKTELYKDGDIEVLYVNTLKYSGDINKIKKGIAILTRPLLLENSIKKYYKNECFSYIIGYTPFMADPYLIAKLKRTYNSRTLLFLWDIFPQNAKDLGMMNNSFLFNLLKIKEKKMYKNFDKIICNCEGQIDYIEKNKLKEKKNLLIIRNCEYKLSSRNIKKSKDDKKILKEENGYNNNDIIAVFGGNMGIPQQLENLLKMIEKLKDDKKLKFIFLGTGSEKGRLTKISKNLELLNLKIMDSVSREEYENILKICDIAMISLNKNYTVPNFPAKVTGYIKQQIPIFASLDNCSKQFLGNFLEKNKVGMVAEAGNIENMKSKFLKMVSDIGMYSAENFEEVYNHNFDIDLAYNEFDKKIFKGEYNV